MASTDNGISYKSQLIVGAITKISAPYPTKAEADEEVARQALIDIHPDGLQIVQQVSGMQRKRHSIDHVYYSDEDELPSYDYLVQDMLKEANRDLPSFTYMKGKVGWLCSAKIKLENGVEENLVSLREHSGKGTAKEDVCHDLYVLLKSALVNSKNC
jgi:hypothetical protein